MHLIFNYDNHYHDDHRDPGDHHDRDGDGAPGTQQSNLVILLKQIPAPQ